MVVTREFMAANNREKQSGETFEIVDKNQLKVNLLSLSQVVYLWTLPKMKAAC